MIKDIKYKLFVFVFLVVYIPSFAQIQTQKDTVSCLGYNLIMDCPSAIKVTYTHYEEGFFKTINCAQDSSSITIFCGTMMNLPLINNKTDETIYSDFVLGNDVRVIRGCYWDTGIAKNIFFERMIILNMTFLSFIKF